MTAVLLLASMLIGQCPGGACPAPSSRPVVLPVQATIAPAWGWYDVTLREGPRRVYGYPATDGRLWYDPARVCAAEAPQTQEIQASGALPREAPGAQHTSPEAPAGGVSAPSPASDAPRVPAAEDTLTPPPPGSDSVVPVGLTQGVDVAGLARSQAPGTVASNDPEFRPDAELSAILAGEAARVASTSAGDVGGAGRGGLFEPRVEVRVPELLPPAAVLAAGLVFAAAISARRGRAE